MRTPTIRWPGEFTESGPSVDPNILLTARATIGDIPFDVSALRMRKGCRIPDYRDGIAEDAYDAAFDCVVDDIEDLTGSTGTQLVTIGGAQYLLWMVPAARP